ncbi:hypothetical protein N7528_007508 [Penicillium herquei]|nr:hypothetical protein N7528_007508 [Penicillium herquei]
MDSFVNTLEYLRSKTQVDLDDLDIDVAEKGAMGIPFADATSNQILVLLQVQNPANAELVQRTLSITNELHPRYPALTFEELAVEVATLGTTVFSMEQCILAGEVGCVSVSPFIHDLKKLVCPNYKDEDPVIKLCVQAQMYYKSHNIPTRVKACSSGSLNEILQLAGVDAHTLELVEIDALAREMRDRHLLQSINLFEAPKNISSYCTAEYPSYTNDEARFRVDLAASKGGMSQLKLYRAIDIFCDYQKKVEEFFLTIKQSS